MIQQQRHPEQTSLIEVSTLSAVSVEIISVVSIYARGARAGMGPEPIVDPLPKSIWTFQKSLQDFSFQ